MTKKPIMIKLQTEENLDEKIIKEKGNAKCIFYSDDVCRKGDKTRDCVNCARVKYHSLYSLNWDNQERLQEELKAKEQECEEFRQTLHKIEKLAIQGNIYCIDYNVDDCEKCIKQNDCKTTLFKQILQKCEEVLNDE